jgi:hypothetical protein
MPFDFAKECRDNQIDEKFVRRIDRKLFLLIERAEKINPNFNQFLSEANKDVSETNFSNLAVFENLLNRTGVQLYPKEIATLFMFEYLAIVESLLTYIVDVIVFALVSTGKDFENPKDKKNVCLPEEIRLVPTGDKLGFLSANGFSMIAKRCSVQIRNCSAHLNYTVDNDGNILLPKGGIIKFVDGMNDYHDKLRDAAIGGFIAFRHYYSEKYGKYMP